MYKYGKRVIQIFFLEFILSFLLNFLVGKILNKRLRNSKKNSIVLSLPYSFIYILREKGRVVHSIFAIKIGGTYVKLHKDVNRLLDRLNIFQI